MPSKNNKKVITSLSSEMDLTNVSIDYSVAKSLAIELGLDIEENSLGSGGNATVYKTACGKVIKINKPYEFEGDREHQKKMLQHEVMSYQKVSKDNDAEFFTYEHGGKEYYIIQKQFIEGESFALEDINFDNVGVFLKDLSYTLRESDKCEMPIVDFENNFLKSNQGYAIIDLGSPYYDKTLEFQYYNEVSQLSSFLTCIHEQLGIPSSAECDLLRDLSYLTKLEPADRIKNLILHRECIINDLTIAIIKKMPDQKQVNAVIDVMTKEQVLYALSEEQFCPETASMLISRVDNDITKSIRTNLEDENINKLMELINEHAKCRYLSKSKEIVSLLKEIIGTKNDTEKKEMIDNAVTLLYKYLTQPTFFTLLRNFISDFIVDVKKNKLSCGRQKIIEHMSDTMQPDNILQGAIVDIDKLNLEPQP